NLPYYEYLAPIIRETNVNVSISLIPNHNNCAPNLPVGRVELPSGNGGYSSGVENTDYPLAGHLLVFQRLNYSGLCLYVYFHGYSLLYRRRMLTVKAIWVAVFP